MVATQIFFISSRNPGEMIPNLTSIFFKGVGSTVRGSAVHALSGVASTRGWFWARVASTVLARVARVTASSVHAVRGLICTRPRASSVHAEWFCCMYTFVLTAVYFVGSMCAGCQVQVFSNLTAVYFVCSMCAGCQVHNNAFWTCVKYVPKQSIP